MVASSFPRSLSEILKHEGGYTNHPADPGGPTNRGVTLGEAQRLGLDVDHDGDVDIIDIKSLTAEDAGKVFHENYWKTVRADDLPAGVDYAVFDFAVNSGNNRAIKFLQEVVSAEIDGTMGPKTLAAVWLMNPADIVNQLCDDRLAWLKRLPTWPVFGPGWGTRCVEVKALGAKMALAQSPRPGPVPFPPPGPPDVPKPDKPAKHEAPSIWSVLAELFAAIFGKR